MMVRLLRHHPPHAPIRVLRSCAPNMRVHAPNGLMCLLLHHPPNAPVPTSTLDYTLAESPPKTGPGAISQRGLAPRHHSKGHQQKHPDNGRLSLTFRGEAGSRDLSPYG